ncbi:MAG: alcohol dehydrogenase catalytic domain-containing protein [Pyrinomonadaceae bacterium]
MTGGMMTGVVQYALEPHAVELRELPVPEIEERDVLLEVGAVSVCGSDVHQYYNKQSWPVRVPVVLGHEFCGTVAAVGRGVRGFREGDRVVSETAARICENCIYCRTGNYNICPQRKASATASTARWPTTWWCRSVVCTTFPILFLSSAPP